MCTRITLTIPLKDLEIRFDIDEVYFRSENPGYNIAPSQKISTVIYKDSKNTLTGMHWGLIPGWKGEKNSVDKMINARAESLHEKPSFHKPFHNQRCLILADGFFEWKTAKTGTLPFYFKLKDDDAFGIAGIYDIWKPNSREEYISCAIITTESNSVVGAVHDRMPVIVEQEDENIWTNSKSDMEVVKDILKSFPAEKMKSYPVRSKYVNSPTKYNSAKCLQPTKRKSLLDYLQN